MAGEMFDTFFPRLERMGVGECYGCAAAPSGLDERLSWWRRGSRFAAVEVRYRDCRKGCEI